MSNVVVTMFMSLDGVIGEPQEWSFPYWNDAIATFKFDELMATDAHLLGRVTYEGFAEAWPSRTDEEGFADRMNSLPKYVVSTTLEKAEWNNSHIIRGSLNKEIGKLKAQYKGDILVAGSATLANALMQQNLVDEYRLLVYPVTLGKGKRLFQDGSEAQLKLTEARSFSSGVVLLRYTADAGTQ